MSEAELLLEHCHHERAFFLGVAAYEELAKSQIVADFISGVVSREEFDEAFRNHAIKAAFHERYVQLPSGELRYETGRSGGLVQARSAALYVNRSPSDEPSEPSQAITREMAREMLQRVREELHSIMHAEWLNGRLGTKALVK